MRLMALGLLSTLLALVPSCKGSKGNSKTVSDKDALHRAISEARPGDEIIMANGIWKDTEIRFVGQGEPTAPITLRAETGGKVILSGASDLKLGGSYLHVEGLYFKNGAAPSNAVVAFAINGDTVANHSTITNVVIEDYNKSQRNQTDLWVLLKGRHNEVTHCYLAGKSNRGPTLRVDLEGNKSIRNYHKITNNYFGPRPPKGGPSAETIQIGNSYTSMAPSHTLVQDNFFDRCNGEVEIISSKTNFNEFRNNVFYKSEGSLVTRHGNYCIVDGNYFIGDGVSEQIGGVRLIGTGHWVTNNYFYKLKGRVFRSPLAVMNGIPKSPLNRYIQVTDVVVAHNSWVDCTAPMQFGVGSNIDQKAVLPASEIRSERPIRTIIANNLIYNNKADKQPIIAHDSLDGISFESNLINNQGVSFPYDTAFKQEEFALTEVADNILVPSANLSQIGLYEGFEFELITKDLFGNPRAASNAPGAISGASTKIAERMDVSKYGPNWYAINGQDEKAPKTYPVASVTELVSAIQEANNGDVIELTADTYPLDTSLVISKALTIRSVKGGKKAVIVHSAEAETPVFEMNPKGKLTLQSVVLKGNKTQYAFASLRNNMSSLYNLSVVDCEISDFDFVLKAYKHSFSEFIKFQGTSILNCANGLELAAEDDDRGEYNAENVRIEHCTFKGVGKNVIDYYRGGYDESTVGGNLIVANSSFVDCGAKEKSGILINTYGIINVYLANNSFIDNQVSLVARLWGAKNNAQKGNTLKNSGNIIVEENLPLTLMY